MDINADPRCSRNTDPDMALDSNWGPDVNIALGVAQSTQISMTPAARPSITNMIFTQSLERTENTDINIGPGCYRVMDTSALLNTY